MKTLTATLTLTLALLLALPASASPQVCDDGLCMQFEASVINITTITTTADRAAGPSSAHSRTVVDVEVLTSGGDTATLRLSCSAPRCDHLIVGEEYDFTVRLYGLFGRFDEEVMLYVLSVHR